jgi:hypothetical protein
VIGWIRKRAPFSITSLWCANSTTRNTENGDNKLANV